MRFPDITAKELIRKIENRFKDNNMSVSSNFNSFTYQVIQESENYMLNLKEVRELANILNIPYQDPPHPYEKWIPGFSNYIPSLQFVNPAEPKEYILLIQPKNNLGSMEVLHRTAGRFTSMEIFQKLIPFAIPELSSLQNNFVNELRQKHPDILQKPQEEQGRLVRGSFSRNIVEPINREWKKANTNLDPFTIRLIYTFFDICVPEVDGICSQCFQVSFPKSGFGISYENKLAPDLKYEIRVSPGKLGGYPQQREIYITNSLNITGTHAHIKWRKSSDSLFTFTKDVSEEITHLPYHSTDQEAVRNFLKSEAARMDFRQLSNNKTPNLVFPICQCP